MTPCNNTSIRIHTFLNLIHDKIIDFTFHGTEYQSKKIRHNQHDVEGMYLKRISVEIPNLVMQNIIKHYI